MNKIDKILQQLAFESREVASQEDSHVEKAKQQLCDYVLEYIAANEFDGDIGIFKHPEASIAATDIYDDIKQLFKQGARQ